MKSDVEKVMQTLSERARVSDRSDFYRRHWRGATKFVDLPITARQELIATPLSKRRFKQGPEIVKIVHDTAGSFLSAWSVSDIRLEVYGAPSKRPMVYFRDMHESVEKSTWCFANRMPRLLGEENSAISRVIAEKFRIDAFIGDTDSLSALEPYLATRDPLEHISLVGSSFDPSLSRFAPYAKRFRLVLSLPETGAIAEAEFSEQPEFKPVRNAYLEVIDGRYVLTKKAFFVTPIIRYDTGIRIADVAISPISE